MYTMPTLGPKVHICIYLYIYIYVCVNYIWMYLGLFGGLGDLPTQSFLLNAPESGTLLVMTNTSASPRQKLG